MRIFNPKSKSFTLIELLVVVAIIAVLVAMLLSGAERGPGKGPVRDLPGQPASVGPGGDLLLYRVERYRRLDAA